MLWIILDILMLTLGTILAGLVFVLGNATNKLSTNEKIQLYLFALVIYGGGCYGIISYVRAGC